ncbi:MAG: XRE family transcriptional regulator [Bacteroidota bacterium]
METKKPSHTREELEALRERALALAPELVDTSDIPSPTPAQWAGAKLVVPAKHPAIIKMRTVLMTQLRQHIEAQGWTQSAAAEVLGETQPRISQLMNGHIHRFSIDHLVTLLSRIGVSVDVSFQQAA